MSTRRRDNEVLVLDGGFSNELNKYCTFDVHQEPLWTAKALINEHDAVVKTHLAYLDVGSDIIETSTFQATVPGFREYNSLDEIQSEHLMKTSVTLAKDAIDQYIRSELFVGSKRERPLVGGSIGPYGAYLRDGSEYSGKYVSTVTDDQLNEVHLPRIRALVEAGSDILIAETLPSLREAERILQLVNQYYPHAKVWVAFSVKSDDSLRTPCNETFVDVFNAVTKYDQVSGFGINCCQPKDVDPFLKEIVPLKKQLLQREGRAIDIVVYPNSGDDWVQGKGWIKKDIPTVDEYAKDWMDLGATVVGGCCQIGPEGIRKLRDVVDDWNKAASKLEL